MKEQGRVIGIEGKNALISFARNEACAGCQACRMGAEQDMQVSIQNTLGARVGDVVEVELEAKRLLSAGAWAYLFPLVMLFIGLAAGYLVAPALGLEREITAAITALATTALAYVALRLMDARFAAKTGYSPAMCGIITKTEHVQDI